MNSLQLSVTSLIGVTPDLAQRLEKLHIFVVQDLLFHLPLRYENRTQNRAIGSLAIGQKVLISGQVEFTDILRRKKRSMVCRISDGTGAINLRFFHFNTQQFTALSTGKLVSCFGSVRQGFAGLEIVHPEYKIVSALDSHPEQGSLTAIYPLTEGVQQTTLQALIKQALEFCVQQPDLLVDYLPEKLLLHYQYPSLLDALQSLHHPDKNTSLYQLENQNTPALKRLAFEELLTRSLSMLKHKSEQQRWKAVVLTAKQSIKNQFIHSLPFELTTAQQRVISEIEVDCNKPQPMLRLVQGDVGSGKTVVAACTALLALANDYQVAIMAPTELLAEQHYRVFSQWFKAFDYPIAFLSGQLKGKARERLLYEIDSGRARLIIGTHALFQEAVEFQYLGLIIIDEQHRFGVHQRLALSAKGQRIDSRPHQLVMTATPIPRTLAMLQYADLDISIIDELPKGRKAVITRVTPAERRFEVVERTRQWIAVGHQGYWVCPLIEKSEKLQYEAAEKTFQQLSVVLPQVRIGLVHGRMKSAEKNKVMQRFKAHELDLLVATTVIEVGVDVANASLMIIENAERLGLSQLHQLRGRVGRGSQDSYCLLLYQSPLTEIAQQRLRIIRATQDGFEIAEQDLRLRGAGELMGTRQTGSIQFKIASPDRDSQLLRPAQQAAHTVLQHYPASVEPLINRWIGDFIQYAEV
ncbi:MAG: ATP-dependent DNA helicase RecG [Methylococcaceae bacterium]|nr:ATP-dependent DNA helicase RecG [Methylococcaceae bacterium]